MIVAVIVAHPDDEVLGCGGAIARHVADGDTVHVLTYTDGVSSRGALEDAAVAIGTRAMEHGHAARVLGLTSWRGVTGPAFRDQQLDTSGLLTLAREASRAVDEWAPAVVYTHWPHDLNQDHRAVAQAVLIATRPWSCGVRRVLACEVPESTAAAFGGPAFAPNWYVPLDDTQVAVKLRALAAYQSERRDWPHPRSESQVRSLSEARGAAVGVPYAEAFVLLREVCW